MGNFIRSCCSRRRNIPPPEPFDLSPDNKRLFEELYKKYFDEELTDLRYRHATRDRKT